MKMSESWFQPQPRIQSLIYFCARLLRELGDSTYFSDTNFRGDYRPSFSEMGPNYTEFSEDVHPSSMIHILCWRVGVRYIASFWNLQSRKLGQMWHYLTPPVKIGRGVGELSRLKRSSINGALAGCFKFLIAPFQNQSSSNATGVENRGQISHCCPTLCKI